MEELKSVFHANGLYIRTGILFKSLIILFVGIIITLIACDEQNPAESVDTNFELTSSDIQSDSLLPKEYTCDGEGATLPLEWSGFSESTKCFALIMHHEASPTDIHWYWVLYDIPLSVKSLPKNVTGIGTLGNNSVNGKTEYAPPCSQGPGPKKYIYTIYALSESVNLTVPNSEVSRAVLLDAMKNITLASITLTVIYSRDI
jgi:phosphatidylethanolamine-binding protein (PEBP) family uncharacterized protein